MKITEKLTPFRKHHFGALLLLSFLVSGCSSWGVEEEKPAKETVSESAKKVEAESLNVDDYYEVEHEGRLYVFDDAKGYLSFLSTHDAPYRLTRIGSGPNGETVVFALRKEDKKKQSGIAGVMMYEGKLDGAEQGFYAEIQREGRIYVFNEWKDVQDFRSVGEAPYRYTDIGAGPNGVTVVYVLNKSNKKVRPDSLIGQFRALHSM